MAGALLGAVTPAELAQAFARVAARALRDADEPLLQVADAATLARLRALPVPARGRPLDTVLDELLRDVLPYRGRMDHHRFFAHVPGPASPLSMLGELLTAVHNPHAGNWHLASGPACIETALLGWLAARLGLPASAGGLFVSGGSMANLTALAVARDQRLAPGERHLGVAYICDQGHASIAKALRLLGLLPAQIRCVPSDAAFRFDVARLSAAIAQDRDAGLLPFVVVASAGSTNTGAIDPLPALHALAASERLWLHVDGAFGASAALSPSLRPLLEGIEQADSVAWDAHKWLFQTYGCGVVLLRDRAMLQDSFALQAEYLDDTPLGDAPAFWDLGPELTRPARALKLWLCLQVLGSERVAAAIEHGCALAAGAEAELRRCADWRITSPAQLATLTFRYAPPGLDETRLDALQHSISRRLLAEGVAAVLPTRLHGRAVLRICALHPDATAEDMRRTVARLDLHARQARAELAH